MTASWRFHVLLGVALFSQSCSPPTRRVASPAVKEDVTLVTSSGDAERLLRDVARAARGSGASELQVLGFGAGAPGDRVEAMVAVPQGSCALIVARATGTVEDLDLHVYGDDGSPFGMDESPDDLPTLLLCPDSDVRLFASARVAQGQGLVALGVQSVGQRDAKAVAAAVGARNFADGTAPVQEGWPGLDVALQERRDALGGEWIDRRRVALPVDSRVPTHLTVEVPQGRCLDALLLPNPDISGLQLTASDEQGRLFARGSQVGHERTLLLCSPSRDRSVTLKLRPYAGRGVAVAVLSVSRGSLESLDLAPGVEALHIDRGQPPTDQTQLPAPTWVKRTPLRRGQITSVETKVQGCARIDFIPDDKLGGFLASAWDPQGRLVGEATGQPGAPLFVCADTELRIDLEARYSSGELTLELRGNGPPPSGTKPHLLATSRLLSEAYEGGFLHEVEEIGRVQVAKLTDSKLHRIELSIPASHCQTVFVAGDHGTYGIEARITDKKTGLDLDRTVARHAVTARACAPTGGHLDAVLELKTSSGETEALWASRQERLPPVRKPQGAGSTQ